MVTHSSILTGRIPWKEEPSQLHTVHTVSESETTEAAEHAHTHMGSYCYSITDVTQVSQQLASL